MEVLYPRCAGLDVHARSVTACVRLASGRDVAYQHRTVATTTRGLLARRQTGRRLSDVALLQSRDASIVVRILATLPACQMLSAHESCW
jgi:hypothetical protein